MDELLLSDNAELQGKFLIFSVHDVEYGIDIGNVTEIIGIQDMTPIPNSPPYVRGITNIRGTIVPVVDMRLRFGIEEAEYNERTCIVLISSENMYIGLVVDSVEDVVQLTPENILPLPQGSVAENNKYLKAIGKDGENIKQIIDIERIFETDAVAVL